MQKLLIHYSNHNQSSTQDKYVITYDTLTKNHHVRLYFSENLEALIRI